MQLHIEDSKDRSSNIKRKKIYCSYPLTKQTFSTQHSSAPLDAF